jgi:hypothetical protein
MYSSAWRIPSAMTLSGGQTEVIRLDRGQRGDWGLAVPGDLGIHQFRRRLASLGAQWTASVLAVYASQCGLHRPTQDSLPAAG